MLLAPLLCVPVMLSALTFADRAGAARFASSPIEGRAAATLTATEPPPAPVAVRSGPRVVAPPSGSSPPCQLTGWVREGSDGANAACVEQLLDWYGLPVIADGVISAEDAALIRIMQTHLGVVVDGVVGPQTAGAIGVWAPPPPPPAPAPGGDRWLSIPAIGLEKSVVNGGQGAIDAGRVVNYSGCRPGGCTVHLAGHHSTHGAVFNQVDELGVGARVTLWWDGARHDYSVVSKDLVGQNSSYDSVIYGDAVLQTSSGSGRVWLLYLDER
ncbi:MAG: sortase domain-bontaining protein [Desertimonas sp.]